MLTAADLNGEINNVLNNPVSLISPLTANVDWDGFDLVDLGELEFRDESADPTADGRIRRSGDELTWRTQDARTNTTTRNFALWSDTSGAPAASIGIGMLFQAESADENPSDFGAVDFVATDVTAASEDTACSIQVRSAGAALAEALRIEAAQVLSSEDARTNTTVAGLTVRRTTTGVPAASIGTRLLIQGESADEAPSDFAAFDAIATDITAASEDTDLLVMLRDAGAALAERFRVTSDGEITLRDTTANPTAGGNLARNGRDLLFHDGGTAMRLSTILNRDVVEAEVVSDAGPTTVYSFSVPGNTLGTNRQIHLMAIGDHLNNDGAGRTLTLRAQYGGTVVGTWSLSLGPSATRRPINLQLFLSAANATNAQRSSMITVVGNADGITGAASTGDQGSSISNHASIAVDSTAAQTLLLDVQHANANATISTIIRTVQVILE